MDPSLNNIPDIVLWRPRFGAFLGLMILSSCLSTAQWSQQPTVNTPVSTAAGYQVSPAAASDGSGGMIVVWSDNRNGSDYEIYGQRLDASGLPLWTSGGLLLCAASGNQYTPVIVQSGHAGAIIAWQDRRGGPSSSDIYAQRVSLEGSLLWGDSGKAVSLDAGIEFNPVILPDGSGGAVVVWQNQKVGVRSDLYAQRIDSSGTLIWSPSNGVTVQATTDSWYQNAVYDSAGGIIVTWEDYRSGSDYDIYVQRILLSNGQTDWTANGVAVCTAAQNQVYPVAALDGSNGAIISWADNRNGTGSSSIHDIYAQRISSTGSILWQSNGVVVARATGIQTNPSITGDGKGGAFIAWQDKRSGDFNIYAQEVDNTGAGVWAKDGIIITSVSGDQITPKVVSDGAGGVIVVWVDYRNTTADLFAQRVSSIGTLYWSGLGVPLTLAASDQRSDCVITDGEGGVLSAWEDNRNGSASDIYAQRLSQGGILGSAPTVLTGGALSGATWITLHGTVNPNGYPAEGWFQYDTTLSYRNSTAPKHNLGSGTDTVAILDSVTVLPNTRYYYRGAATNDAGTGYGADLAVITMAARPESLRISAFDSTHLDLSWRLGAGGARSGRIYRSSDGLSYGYLDSTAGTTYRDGPLKPNTRYWYRVTAVNLSGLESPPSAEQSALTLPMLPWILSVQTPAGIRHQDVVIAYDVFVPEGDTVTFSFAYSLDGGASFTPTGNITLRNDELDSSSADTVTWHSGTDVPLAELHTCRFRVTPLSRYGSGLVRQTTDFTLDNKPPVFSGLASCAGDTDKIRLSWPPATDISPPVTYSVYRSAASGGENFSAPDTTTVDTAITVVNLARFQRYYFVVRASDAAGNAEVNAAEKNTVPSLARAVSLAAPGQAQRGLIVIPYRVEVFPQDSARLNCYFSIDGGSSFNLTTNVTGQLGPIAASAADTVKWASSQDFPGETSSVRFRIVPWGKGGVGAGMSTADFTVDNKPPVFGGLQSAVPETNSVQLAWNAASDLDTPVVYLVYRAGSSGGEDFHTPSAQTQGTGLSVGGLLNFERYYFVVRARDALGNADSGMAELGALPAPKATVSSLLAPPEPGRGDLRIVYTVNVLPEDTVLLACSYSSDGGAIYHAAANITGIHRQISGITQTQSDTLVWASALDFQGESPSVRFRIVPGGRAGNGGGSATPNMTVDNRPPVFSGLQGIMWDTGAIVLSWRKGSDISTPLTYAVYIANHSGGQNFASPDTSLGDTTVLLGGLGNRKDYYFVVRAKDALGNADTNSVERFFSTPPVADFSGDGRINAADLAIFIRAWRDSDEAIADVGPASGMPPDLIPRKDGRVDFEDIVVFGLMWNWSLDNPALNQGVSSAVPLASQGDVSFSKGGATSGGSVKSRQFSMKFGGFDRVHTLGVRLDYDRENIRIDSIGIRNPGGLIVMKGIRNSHGYAMAALASRDRRLGELLASGDCITVWLTTDRADDSVGVTVEGYSAEARLVNFVTKVYSLSSGLRLPQSLVLFQNYPNPFNPSTTIRYGLPSVSRVDAKVFNVLGEAVKILYAGEQPAGFHQLEWDGRSDAGAVLPSGLYFCRVQTKSGIETKKMLLVR